MAGVNKAIILGRLGADPDVRSFSNGGRVVNLRVATSERYKDKDGNQQERTSWHSVAIFNEKLGEIAERYLRKGSEVYLEGQLETRKWQDQSGQDKYATEIVLRQFRGELALIGGRASGDGAGVDTRAAREPGRGQSDGRREPARGSPAGGGGRSGLDDDIPFAPCVD